MEQRAVIPIRDHEESLLQRQAGSRHTSGPGHSRTSMQDGEHMGNHRHDSVGTSNDEGVAMDSHPTASLPSMPTPQSTDSRETKSAASSIVEPQQQLEPLLVHECISYEEEFEQSRQRLLKQMQDQSFSRLDCHQTRTQGRVHAHE